MLFYIAAAVLLALKLAGIAAVSWGVIILVAVAPILIALGALLLAALGIGAGAGVLGIAHGIGALGKALGKRAR